MGLGIRKKIQQLRTYCRYSSRKNVTFGKNVTVEGEIEIATAGNICVGDNTLIKKWVCFRPYGGYIHIGENCSVNSFCHISGNGGVEIGNNVLLATQCVIVSANHNFSDINEPIAKQGETKEKIVIEDDCWLGAGVKVLAGVTIHKGSVIGAGSVITHDVPPYSVVVGVPGKVIKSRLKE